MAILLSLESSTGVCSAALHDDGRLLASTELHISHSTASALAVMIDNLLKLTHVGPSDLKGVAVAAGPGSYTGLRIAVATAKGICFARNIPLIAMGTLELMAWQVVNSLFSSSSVTDGKIYLCPMLDARRMEVYCMITDSERTVHEPVSATVVDETSFGRWLERGKVLFFGDGSDKVRPLLTHANAIFIKDVIPLAAKMGEPVFRKFADGEVEELSSFEPLYLKGFVAKKPKMQI